MATIATDGSQADVQAKHDLITTVDGDVLTIPTGSFTWTATVSFTKRITLQGNTRITGDHNSITTVGSTRVTGMSANDLSIIKDAVALRGTNDTIIKFNINNTTGSTEVCRVSRLTFQPDPSVTTIFNAEGVIRWTGTGTSPMRMRMDECHFNFPKWFKTMKTVGWVTGVVDHCINHSNGSMFALIWTDQYLATGMTTTVNGHGSWADYPKFGSGDFLFFEDNAFIGPNTSGGAGTGNFDSKMGARFVSRYNQWFGSKLNSHGTGAGPQRGVRAIMQYGDTTYYSFSPVSSGEMRSGSGIFHDNTNYGTLPNNNTWPFRLYPDRPDGGQAGTNYPPMAGQSYWDKNADSDGVTQKTDPLDGSSVSGYLFFSAATNPSSGSIGNYTVQMKVNPGWTPNPGKWVGYSIYNATWQQSIGAGAPQNRSGIITASTADTLTYVTYPSSDFPQLQFRLDDVVEIRKPLTGMDEPGRGKGDILVHANVGGVITIKNQSYIPPKENWPRNQEERIFTWNNLHVPTSTPMGISETLFPTINEHENYENILTSVTPFSIPATVAGYYSAAKNGPSWGAYTTDWQYPHELVSGSAPTGPRIDVPISHDFGNIILGNTSEYSIPVANGGDATLSVSSVTYPTGYSVPATAFTVSPGATVLKIAVFTPVAETTYSGPITFNSSAGSGNNIMTATGAGVPPAGGGGHGHGHKKGVISRRV